VEELERVFGSDIVSPDGSLNRVVLRERVFSPNTDAQTLLARLNQITHRYVKEDLFVWCSKMAECGHTSVVIDAPTLFEAGLEKDCTVVIGVIASPDIRAERIAKRDGISLQAAQMRMHAQHDSEFYKLHCDFIVENNTSPNDAMGQTKTIINELLKRGILQ
jgi:dephospho-CoA kinase